MKFIPALFLGFLVAASGASAQSNFSNSVSLVPSPFVAAASAPNVNFASASAPTSSTSILADLAAPIASPEPVPSPAPMPQSVQGVFERYQSDVAVGYTFFRFYETPSDQLNGNGFNVSGTYWYHDWWGPDAEFFATYSRQPDVNSWVGLGAGGLRVRKVMERGLDVWAHGLIGVAYLAPKAPYGSEWGSAAVLGVGADLNAHHRHVAYRLAVDAVGTHFFGVYQLSPKVSVGVVFKF